MTATPPRLIHVTTTDISLALLLGPQLVAFAEAGYEVMGASAPGPFVAELEAQGVRHLPLRHATRARAPHRDLAALAELRSIFRHLRPDIVHTHNPKPGVYGRLAARAAGVPAVVNTVHGLYAVPEDPWWKRTFVYGLERIAARCSHAELVQNPEDLDALARIGVPRHKLYLLGNGIDLARFDTHRVPTASVTSLRQEWGAGPDTVVCLSVGRLVEGKGYLDLFETARLLANRGSDVRFVVAGPDDPHKADALSWEMTERARAAGVRFLGFRSDAEGLYAAADLFVLPSHREGFPRAAMEAAAMGLPVVASDIRGCRQVVDHETTGLLVPARRPAAFAEAIAGLAADPPRRRAMGAAAVEKARREFDQRRVIETTVEVYDRLLSRKAFAFPLSSALPTAGSPRLGTDVDAAAAARLHVAEISTGFLAALGPTFLACLYRRIARHPGSFLVVSGAEGMITGFAAATEDVRALYRSFLLRDGVSAGLAVAPRLVKAWPRVLETLRYPVAKAGLPRAEILAVAVHPAHRNKGLGRALVEAATAELARRGQPAGRVVVSRDNGAAMSLYRACGFRPSSEIELHPGTVSVVFTWP